MGLIRGVARTAVVAGTASAVAGRVQRRQQRKWGAQDAAAQEEQAPAQEPEQPQQPQQADAAPPPAGAAPAASGSGDLVAQLQQLETLRQQGALTDEEFGAAKAKLLGG